MAKITLKIEIEYESWFNDDREPKTKDEWKSFFESHFMPESSILGVDDGETRDMIAINSYSVEVTECSTEAENNMKVFSQVHKDCVKTWVEPVADGNGKTLEENKNWWLINGEHGISSKNMFAVLSGYAQAEVRLCTPSDPDDFKRCSQLLQAVPQWRSELHKLKPISKTWSNLVDNWDKLETMLIEARELWSKNKGAKEMYDFMKQLGC